jgi:hypothetical protein
VGGVLVVVVVVVVVSIFGRGMLRGDGWLNGWVGGGEGVICVVEGLMVGWVGRDKSPCTY